MAAALLAGGWPAAVSASAEVSVAEARRALAEAQAQGGYGDMVPRAVGLVAAARRSPGAGESRALAAAAVEAAPGEARIRFARARLALSPPFAPALFAAETLAGLRALALDPWLQATWPPRLAAAVCAGALVVGVGLGLAGLLAGGGPLLHDYRDSFPIPLRGVAPLGFGLAVACAAWLAGLGPLGFGCVLAALLAPYLPRRAAVGLGVSLLLGGFLPAALAWSSAQGGPSGDRAWALYRVSKGDAGGALDADLRRVFPPGDARGLFARGLLARRAGDLTAAERLLEEAASRRELGGLARLELGNVRFLRGRLAEALVEYEVAASQRPADPVPWLNRHLVHLARLEFALADHALERARALDRSAVDRYGGVDARPHPVSLPLPPAWIRDELLLAGASTPWARQLGAALFAAGPGGLPPALGGFVLVCALAGRRTGARHRSWRCPRCGEVVCPRCSRRVKGSEVCPGCWLAGRDRSGDAAERERRAELARAWDERRDRRERWGGVVLPGWWGFAFGERPRGVGLGVAWALGLGWLAVAWGYPAPLFPWGGGTGAWVGAVALAAHGVGVRAAGPAPRRGGR
ncbi:MAG: hypothetical protein ACYDA8_11585 [Deferrisomatales bacterium]